MSPVSPTSYVVEADPVDDPVEAEVVIFTSADAVVGGASVKWYFRV